MSLASRAASADQVSYIITAVDQADPSHRHFHITITASHVTDPFVTFAIPAWSPGWYVLTHAYKNIGAVSAANESGEALPVTHPDDLNWRVQVSAGVSSAVSHAVTISYDLAPVDPDPDALFIRTPSTKSYGFFEPYLDENNGFVPGPASMLYMEGAKQVPCSVTYRIPPGWAIASANDPAAYDPYTFTAPDYDTLADQPADLGKFSRWDRVIDGVTISVLIVGGEGIIQQTWVDDLFRIAAAGIRLMGGKPPFPRYIFQCRFPSGIEDGAGLEHKNCTVIILPPESLRHPGPDDMELIAHEFFHAWNVKRVRPTELGPFDYAHPVRVPDLWWLEGVTDNFALMIAGKAGVVSPSFWRAYLGNEINSLQNNSARKVVTLETASLKAWEGKSEGYGGLTYYNKGAVVGLLLDIEMRRHTENRVGLPDLEKALFDETAASGKGYPDGEIERMASKLTGVDLKPFFDRALRSTEELPYADILPAAGLVLTDSVAPGSAEHFYHLQVVQSPTPQQAAILASLGGINAGQR